VGFSGGLDSTVLLHLLARLQTDVPFALSVCHIHHGLSPRADAWLAHCAAQADALRLPFVAHRVDLSSLADDSIEARARAARY
jgi:tRNA(Ile)-lysidine synthase